MKLLVLDVKWSRGLYLPLVYESSFDSPLFLFAEAGWESKEERPLVLYDEPEFSFAISNLTTPLGREAVLSCVVDHLGKYRVSGSQYICCRLLFSLCEGLSVHLHTFSQVLICLSLVASAGVVPYKHNLHL